MADYLDFKDARCRDCYKCLRECPVKAIAVRNHQARIIDERCILCGHCTVVCPQNAKVVHSELDQVKALLASGRKVVACVAPSYVSSFNLQSFSIMQIALGKLGFSEVEEVAEGAQLVTEAYRQQMLSGEFRNYITSACPAACRMIQHYYPSALKYLAPVVSPMIAHASMVRKRNPEAGIVFIGPCIAKKREAADTQLIDQVLTFEELQKWFDEAQIHLEDISEFNLPKAGGYANLAKAYPISHGIITSFGKALPEGWSYMAVDGPDRCADVLENIDSLDHVFIELNSCKDACVSGPCSIAHSGGSVRATRDVREYVEKEKATHPSEGPVEIDVDLTAAYPRLRLSNIPPTDKEITSILARTGKFAPEDELNCGACGYNTCREKAWAVYNGFADIEMCVPYMRKRAESMSYEIIRSNPDGVVVLDSDMNIVEINHKACELLGITAVDVKGCPASDYFGTSDYITVLGTGRPILGQREFIPKTNQYVDLSISLIKENHMLFGVLRDVTAKANYEEKLHAVKLETLETTDEVIKKQMRVAQEIASLLGETTAETKVALLKLKQTLQAE
ncbi:MAG: PAS domain S-box protein [Bacteroidales bacterium]|nr:PAS domain S-box protein [Bacteroidales bacterium]